MRIECNCGLSLECKKLPFYCRCGKVYHPEGVVAATCCKFRGERRGWATCRCGVIYACQLHGGLCSEKTPADDLVEIQFDDGSKPTLIRFVNYRPCGTCDDYTNGAVEAKKTPVP